MRKKERKKDEWKNIDWIHEWKKKKKTKTNEGRKKDEFIWWINKRRQKEKLNKKKQAGKQAGRQLASQHDTKYHPTILPRGLASRAIFPTLVTHVDRFLFVATESRKKYV